MQYILKANDPRYYATNLRYDANVRKLKWDNAQGQDVILIQHPFGERVTKYLNDICEALDGENLQAGNYREILPGIWICYVSAAEKAKNNGYMINDEAHTYTVLGCSMDADTCTIYEPQYQAMISPSCDIPLNIRIIIEQQTEPTGLIRKRIVPTGFYEIRFPKDFSASYHEGDLQFEIESLVIPVTKEMIENGIVFVKSEYVPTVKSMNKGLSISN